MVSEVDRVQEFQEINEHVVMREFGRVLVNANIDGFLLLGRSCKKHQT